MLAQLRPASRVVSRGAGLSLAEVVSDIWFTLNQKRSCLLERHTGKGSDAERS